MRILIVEPLSAPREKEIDGTLESMQEIVGGYIEAIYPFEDASIALICNDEGKLTGQPNNRVLYGEDGNICDVVAGTFFLCAAPPDSENFESLNDEQMQFCKERFATVELIF